MIAESAFPDEGCKFTVKSVQDILQRLLRQCRDLGNLPITEESFESLRHAQEHLVVMTHRAVSALEQELGDHHQFALGQTHASDAMTSLEKEVAEAFEYCSSDQANQADLLRGALEAHSMSSHMIFIDEVRKELDNDLGFSESPELQELRSSAVAVRRRSLEELIAKEKKRSEELFDFIQQDLRGLMREQFRQINEEYLRVKEVCKHNRAELIRKLQSEFETEEEHIRAVLETEHQANIQSLKGAPLQRRELLNHVELIRDAVAGFLGGSVEDLKADVLGHLQCLAQQMGAEFSNSDFGQQRWEAAAFKTPPVSAARAVPVELAPTGAGTTVVVEAYPIQKVIRSVSAEAIMPVDRVEAPSEDQDPNEDSEAMFTPNSESRAARQAGSPRQAGYPRQVRPPSGKRALSPGDKNLARSPSAPSVGSASAYPPEQTEVPNREEELGRSSSDAKLATVDGVSSATRPRTLVAVRSGSSRNAGSTSDRTLRTPIIGGSGSPLGVKRSLPRDAMGLPRTVGNVRGTSGSSKVATSPSQQSPPPVVQQQPTAASRREDIRVVAARREKSSEARRGAAQRSQSRENAGPGAAPRRRSSPPPGMRNTGTPGTNTGTKPSSNPSSIRGTRSPQGSSPATNNERPSGTAPEEAEPENTKVSLDFSMPLSGSASTVSSDSDLDRMDSVLTPWEAQQQGMQRMPRGRREQDKAPQTVARNGSWQQSHVNSQAAPSVVTMPKAIGGQPMVRAQPQQNVPPQALIQQTGMGSRLVRPPAGVRLIPGSG